MAASSARSTHSSSAAGHSVVRTASNKARATSSTAGVRPNVADSVAAGWGRATPSASSLTSHWSSSTRIDPCWRSAPWSRHWALPTSFRSATTSSPVAGLSKHGAADGGSDRPCGDEIATGAPNRCKPPTSRRLMRSYDSRNDPAIETGAVTLYVTSRWCRSERPPVGRRTKAMPCERARAGS